MPKVSIIIKTLNEESNIERAIRSALGAIAPFGGEVIVADSGSTDRTVERAVKFPVAVVQLARPTERCCGIAAQLGYQHSIGEYVHVLDGDMELDAGFLSHAVSFLDSHAAVAGVGGYIHEMRVENLEFEARVRRQHRREPKQAADVDCLSGGGLYRRAAIEDVGYLSDRNLHSFEEYELGARLRAKNWRIVRLPDHAADHYSYSMRTYPLLWSRVRSGYILGIGELLRSSLACGYLKAVLFELNALRVAVGVWLYWAAVALIYILITSDRLATSFILFALLLPPIAMSVRNRSLKLGFHSVLLWYVSAIGLVIGFARSRMSPRQRVESRLIPADLGQASETLQASQH
jgi:glycosyltransferase involved in cell wall biosynthesis